MILNYLFFYLEQKLRDWRSICKSAFTFLHRE